MRRRIASAALLLLSSVALTAADGCTGDDPALREDDPCSGGACTEAGGGEAGEAGPSISLGIVKIEPATLVIAPSEQKELTVTVDRTKGATGPILVAFTNLTQGLTATPLTVPADAIEGKITLSADAMPLQRRSSPLTLEATTPTGLRGTRNLDVAVRGAAGSIDTTFGTAGSVVDPPVAGGTTARLACVAVDAGGRIYVAGTVPSLGGTAIAAARYDANGARDASWQGGVIGTILGKSPTRAGSCLLDTQRRLVVVGGAGTGPTGAGKQSFVVFRFNDKGEPDGTFGSLGAIAHDFSAAANRLNEGFAVGALPSDGVIAAGTSDGLLVLANVASNGVVVGASEPVNGTAPPADVPSSIQRGADPTHHFAVSKTTAGAWRLHRFVGSGPFQTPAGSWPNGTPGESIALPFDAGPLLVVPGDSMIVAGGSTAGGGFVMRRYAQSTGLMDGTEKIYPVGTAGHAVAIATQKTDGKIILGGMTTATGGALAVVRTDTMGAIDTTFGSAGSRIAPARPGASDAARAMALAPDGRIVLAGETTKDGKTDWLLVRFWP